MTPYSKGLLVDLFTSGLDTMHPARVTGEFLEAEGQEMSSDTREIFLLAVGKASYPMAAAAREYFHLDRKHTLVIVPDFSRRTDTGLNIVRGNHPIPGSQSLAAGQQAVEFVKAIPGHSLLLALISGGASSLMCHTHENIGLDELQKMTRELLESDANIQQINEQREKISKIKGGKLLGYLAPGVRVINAVVSDVPGDDPALVGSGPTVPPNASLEQEGDLPPVRTHVIASARQLAESIASLAPSGMNVHIHPAPYHDTVPSVVRMILKEISQNHAGLYIFYGESSVHVTGNGKGGRNQELALHAAIEISGRKNITWLSMGTDGVDGPTDAAGAVVDGRTLGKARQKGLDAHDYLQRNDSYHFHEQVDTLVKTGPTENNLMDLQLIANISSPS